MIWLFVALEAVLLWIIVKSLDEQPTKREVEQDIFSYNIKKLKLNRKEKIYILGNNCKYMDDELLDAELLAVINRPWHPVEKNKLYQVLYKKLH